MTKYLHNLTFCLCISGSSLFAQVKTDTIIPQKVYKLDLLTMSPMEINLDTSFYDIFEYNPIYKDGFTNTFLGNTGQAVISNNFFDRSANHDFLFVTPYLMYMNNAGNIMHFNTRKPYSELKYITSGTKDDSEQTLSALHTQNVNEFLNIGLFYDLIASKGKYTDSNLGTNRINLFGSYVKTNYSFYTSLHYNGYKAQENGGLIDIEDFVTSKEDALNYEMQLSDANARLKNINLFFTQNINFAGLTKDSARSEKLDNFGFQHTLEYNRYVKSYNDNIDTDDTINYYANNYYLINELYDSAFHHNLSNRFDLSVNLAGNKQEFRVYLKHEFKSFAYAPPVPKTLIIDEVEVDTIISGEKKENFNDISVGGQYIGRLKTWNYTLNGQFYLTGYCLGDIVANGEFIKYFNDKKRNVKLAGELSSRKPSYFLMNYGSSHFEWDNSFNKIETTRGSFEYNGEKNFQTKLSLGFINDYVYFNEQAIPVQYTGELFIASLLLNKTFKLGVLNSKNELLFQKTSTDVVNLPEIAYNNTSWVEVSLFKKALSFQLGVELYYFTNYYADAYMAAIGQFYNQKNQLIGNYPFLSGFLNIKIARTRFTLQYNNAMATWLDANYFMAYRYPNFNETLRFGLAWTFYD